MVARLWCSVYRWVRVGLGMDEGHEVLDMRITRTDENMMHVMEIQMS